MEQAQFILGLQDTTASFVNVGFLDTAFVQRLLQGTNETVAVHIHIQASLQRACRHFLQVTDAMSHFFNHCSSVAHHKTLETIGVTQQVGQQILVGCSRNALKFIERTHVGCSTHFCSFSVRTHIAVQDFLTT